MLNFFVVSLLQAKAFSLNNSIMLEDSFGCQTGADDNHGQSGAGSCGGAYIKYIREFLIIVFRPECTHLVQVVGQSETTATVQVKCFFPICWVINGLCQDV